MNVILQVAAATTGEWAGVPYPPQRLYLTIGFMAAVVAVAVWLVRRQFAGKLVAELAGTLGLFFVIIGGIVYTVAFRGLRTGELALAWLLSGIAIGWFVRRLDAIMSRPLAELEALGSAIRDGDWASIRSSSANDGGDDAGARSALGAVALLIGETRRTSGDVLTASRDVARIGGTVAEGAAHATASLEPVRASVRQGTEASARIREASQQLIAASTDVHTAARETLERSTTVEESARQGVARAQEATGTVVEVAELVRDLVARIEALREAGETVGEITTVVSGIGRQTNLLALNASIEAARAGAHGRGFGVVAEEVGKLATQSTGSIKRIEELVKQMSERMEDAASQVKRMGRAVTSGESVMQDALQVFQAIEVEARRTHELAERVVEATAHSDALAAELGDASALVQGAAEQSAAATREAAAAMEHQRSLTAQLRRTAEALDQSAGSLDRVVSRFGGTMEGAAAAGNATDRNVPLSS
jgi:methyl-accepting chemotaxis protein